MIAEPWNSVFVICVAQFLFTQRSYLISWPNPGSSVITDAGCQSRGCGFDPGSVSILSDVWQKSMWPEWATSLSGKAASCLEILMSGVLVWKKRETHEWWTGRRDMIETLFKTALIPNKLNQIRFLKTLTAPWMQIRLWICMLIRLIFQQHGPKYFIHFPFN